VTDVLYHYTDTARLPWIILSNELQAGKNRLRGLPFDFLWATTSPKVDRSATISSQGARKALRDGWARAVRFTLAAEDFEPWPNILDRLPEWTPEMRERLEAGARRVGQADTSTWRCRVEPLALDRVISMETRGWYGDWVRADNSEASGRNRWRNVVIVNDPPGTRGIDINGKVYLSVRQEIAGMNGATAYAYLPPMTREELGRPLSIQRIETAA
jgi:hypothetical protein